MTSTPLHAAVDFATDSQIKNFYAICSMTVLYYDYLLTLPAEVELFWKRKEFSWFATLFYLNRYSALFAHIPVFMEYLWSSFRDVEDRSVVCLHTHRYHGYYAVIAQVIIGAMLIIRTHALYGHKRRVLVLLLVVTTIGFSLGCWALASSEPASITQIEYWPKTGCIEPLTDTGGKHIAIAWGGLALFDVTVYALTVSKAIRSRKLGPRTRSLVEVILRDASMYIAIMLASQVVNVLTSAIAPTALKGISTTYSTVMASVMVSRLSLNLRDPSLLSPTSTINGPNSALQFAGGTFIENARSSDQTDSTSSQERNGTL
ncbi:hypothetical protein BDN72DRAFT_624437 [Pluteus cervinus]|uniref:Uncharacterized protein n=1 Tax=Pluteus cervinus TaxID=181527 RepID=A0ACD3ATT7_9AGAR|nr:hypothetical protein BDN72DRAFT_624437 [Pluteus cervinus]